jgi:general secretion pathway protein D
VQNGKATELAEVLTQIFSPEPAVPAPSLAPGLTAGTVGQTITRTTPTMNRPAEARAQPPKASTAQNDGAGGLEIDRLDRVQVIADEPNNALLILARGGEYRQILAALRQLDVSPMQVLIEVTIAEVTLTDNLSFGVEWFFKNNFGSRTGEGLLDLGSGAGIGSLVPGFSYALKGPDVRFVLNTLATESNLSILSSPSLLVLNNQEATINVGEEVPLTTQQQQSTVTEDAAIINSIEYRDTGVMLKVKPRVNAGGLVIMEVEQEVSQATSTVDADPLTPRIRQRKISSTVAVDSGNTIILGGLIEETRDLSESGIPGLHKVPVLGALFGTKEDNQDRKELIVLITPRAVSNSNAALQVTEQYRRRLQKLIPNRSAPTGGQSDGAVTTQTSSGF